MLTSKKFFSATRCLKWAPKCPKNRFFAKKSVYPVLNHQTNGFIVFYARKYIFSAIFRLSTWKSAKLWPSEVDDEMWKNLKFGQNWSKYWSNNFINNRNRFCMLNNPKKHENMFKIFRIEKIRKFSWMFTIFHEKFQNLRLFLYFEHFSGYLARRIDCDCL